MGLCFTVIIFLAFRIIDWLISFLSPYFIPYLGFFPYKEVAINYNLPKFLTAFANFDGAHYLLIARNGYAQYQQAFFPFYPLLIRWLSPIFFNNHLLTALIISNVSFLFGLFLFSKYLELVLHSELVSESDIRSRNKFGMTRNSVMWTSIFLVTFPTSFFFGMVYTEGLFFFLLVGCLYFLRKEKYLVAAIFAFFASLTRLVGLFLIIPIVLNVIKKLSNNVIRINKSIPIARLLNYLITFLSPLLGLFVYSFYLFKTTGDPLFFLHSQWAFGANRTSNLILLPQVYFRYLKIFFTARWNFQYFISFFEFTIFNFVLIILVIDLFRILKLRFVSNFVFRISNFDWERLGLNLFSFANILIPTLTGTLSSIPRYALFSLSFFIYLAQVKNTKLKIALAIVFIILHVVVLGFFTQGYFIS